MIMTKAIVVGMEKLQRNGEKKKKIQIHKN